MIIQTILVGTPKTVSRSLEEGSFKKTVFRDVLGGCLGVKEPQEKPGEFSFLRPQTSPCAGAELYGAHLAITGVSRNGRSCKQFHNAISLLIELFAEQVRLGLPTNKKCHVSVSMQLDGEIEEFPGSGTYSSLIERFIVGYPPGKLKKKRAPKIAYGPAGRDKIRKRRSYTYRESPRSS